MTPPDADARVEVTQADRIFAASYLYDIGKIGSASRGPILSGEWDQFEHVRAVARLRLAATAHPLTSEERVNVATVSAYESGLADGRAAALADQQGERGGCTASPDHADIMETIQNAGDDWQKQGYPSALAEVRDMANVGRSLMERIADLTKPGAQMAGWHPADDPAEIVDDLANMLSDAPTDTRGAESALREAEDDGGEHITEAARRMVAVQGMDWAELDVSDIGYWESLAAEALASPPAPEPTERQRALAAMCQWDEEMEALHPGWMTGQPVVSPAPEWRVPEREAIAERLWQVDAERIGKPRNVPWAECDPYSAQAFRSYADAVLTLLAAPPPLPALGEE